MTNASCTCVYMSLFLVLAIVCELQVHVIIYISKCHLALRGNWSTTGDVLVWHLVSVYATHYNHFNSCLSGMLIYVLHGYVTLRIPHEKGKNRSNGPELIGLVRRCIRLYIGKQQNIKAGCFTNGITMFYS